jgi:hypothetical protein
VTANMGPLMPGDDRFVGPATSRVDESGYIVPALQGQTWTPTNLRERASRLIEIGDGPAALEAATLLVHESDRIRAEAAGDFSQTRRIARRVSSAQAHVDAQRERLTYDEHNLSDAVAGLAHRRASLEDLEQKLMAEKQALAYREQSLAVRESEVMAREQALEGLMAQKRGRRLPAEAVPAQAFFDSGPLELRPDPLTAHSVREFLECLSRFRIYAGNRSVRQISEYCGGLISPSTVGNVLRGGTLPDRLEVVDAIVLGCGGSPDDRADFAYTWRRLAMSQFDYESTRTDITPVTDERD